MKLTQTPSQTVGPYFAYGLASKQYGYDFKSLFGPVLAEPQATGEHIRLTGRVFDGDGVPIPDAMLEICQADAEGRFVASRAEARASGFRGFGRCGTGTHPSLHWWFDTVKPGAAAPGEAPCVDVIVTMRGMLLHAFTRIYFDDEREANARDPVLAALPPERRATLVAKREMQPGGVIYRLDLRMQGPKETVFFDL